MDYLSKLPRCYARIVQIGMIPAGPIGSGKFRTNSSKGLPDIVCIYRGQTYWIEVKSEKGKLSPQQQEFLRNWSQCGGHAFVARSIDDVIKYFKEHPPHKLKCSACGY